MNQGLLELADLPGAVERPPLRFFGGKWRLADRIIAHFPAHRVYVEPFGGGGSVLLRKAPSPVEVFNDIDSRLVGLFRVLRHPTQAERLAELLSLTPYAQEELDAAEEMSSDPVEDARRLIVLSRLAVVCRHSCTRRAGLRRDASPTAKADRPAAWAALPGQVEAWKARCARLTVEHGDAIECMRRWDSPDALHYVDPPYLPETRTTRTSYRHELSESQHATLLEFVRTLSGSVILSGYSHPIYESALAGWKRVEVSARASSNATRTEILWINPTAASKQTHPAPLGSPW